MLKIALFVLHLLLPLFVDARPHLVVGYARLYAACGAHVRIGANSERRLADVMAADKDYTRWSEAARRAWGAATKGD